MAVLGIPYATAVRFERPRPVPLADVSECVAFGPAPPQRPGADLVPGSPIVDTDEHRCLTLNVWPARTVDELRPVLVWFYGGSFVTGASSQACFDGTRLAAEQDVVVVSVNYRLGALGFLDLRALGGSVANLGLHDALCALRWVRDNIAALGGDPRRVTVFGESAGGGMCAHLLASPLAHGLFRGAIVQSGVTEHTLDAERAALVATTFARLAGAPSSDELRALPLDAVLDAQTATIAELLPTVGMMPFHPVIDGEVLLAAPAAALGAGVATGVPLLAGTTADEMRLYLDPALPPPTHARLVRRVEKYLGVGAERAEQIVAAYVGDAGPDAWPAIFGDNEMQLPLRRVLDAQAAHAPVYAYLFTWEAPSVGAAHAVDIPFILGNFTDGWAEFVGHDADAERLSAEMRATWARFAATGEPGWGRYPVTMVWGRRSYVAPEHPFTRRLAALAG